MHIKVKIFRFCLICHFVNLTSGQSVILANVKVGKNGRILTFFDLQNPIWSSKIDFFYIAWIINNNKRIAELQQTAGPLKLGVSKIEMAVSRSNIFGSPIWFIYTFYTAKGNINTKYRSPMYSILDTIRKSNIKISIPHKSKRGHFLVKYFLWLFNSDSLVYIPKIRFLPLLGFL